MAASKACKEAFGSHPDSSGCPLEVNEDNMMPTLPNQALDYAATGLDKSRQVSSIARTEHGEKWVYPSPMQFYNALALKNKTTPDEAQYMQHAVMAHNNVNERSWEKVLQWEKQHYRTCPNPHLRRFVGKYNHPTPKSIINRYLWGMPKPFDRHDWFVNRCGQDIRYIIDYYDDPNAKDNVQVYIDARPALDTFGALVDRIKAMLYRR